MAFIILNQTDDYNRWDVSFDHGILEPDDERLTKSDIEGYVQKEGGVWVAFLDGIETGRSLSIEDAAIYAVRDYADRANQRMVKDIARLEADIERNTKEYGPDHYTVRFKKRILADIRAKGLL